MFEGGLIRLTIRSTGLSSMICFLEWGSTVSGLVGSEVVWKVPQSQFLLMGALRRNLNLPEG